MRLQLYDGRFEIFSSNGDDKNARDEIAVGW